MKKSFLIFSIAAFLLASCSNDDDSQAAATGPVSDAVISPNVGGPNQPNQVYIDLSSSTQASIKRDSWDLGFSSGTDFRVIINGSLKMAVKQLTTANIDEVQVEDAAVAVGYSTYSTSGYVDNPTGVLQGTGAGVGTAIAEVSTNDADNKVYLVNMGFEVGTTTPSTGTVSLDGAGRGWKKIRITRNGNNYVLQYADLAATTHQTVTVSKNSNFNFTFLNLKNGQTVNVEPQKDKWDLNFTGFTNYYPFGSSFITYYFADFITTNIHGGTQAYTVLLGDGDVLDDTFANFSKADVVDANFWPSIADQRIIGDSWRNGGGPSSAPSVRDNRFYVVKDASGNLYKLVFRALTNEAGERGFPVFEYELLD
jgi:hypothetical protein